MRAKSHRLLGQYLARRYLTGVSQPCVRAFLAGCTQPDKNPTTYLKGSLRSRWLHGHDYTNAKRYMRRIVLRLHQKCNWNMLDYYTLGKLIHYTADAFTAAHGEDFEGNLFEHRRYECQLHHYFATHLPRPFSPFPHVHNCAMETIRRYHRKYRKCPPNICTDTDYCIGVACLVTEMLTQGQTCAVNWNPLLTGRK